MKISKLLCIVGYFAIASAVPAQIFSRNFTANTVIPDGDLNGVYFATDPSISGIPWPLAGGYYSVSVFLNIQGSPVAYNSDYYASLVNNATGRKAVLLNRVGIGEPVMFGYQDNGFSNVKLSDGAANGDIHVYRNVVNPLGGPLTGTWQPDGRDISPLDATTSTPRTSTLSQFNGINPNGDWTLFIADVAPDGQGTLTTWGLEFTAVPEPQAYAAVAGLVLLGFGAYRRLAVKKA